MPNSLFFVLPIVAILLSIIVHWQYRWNYGPFDHIGSLCYQILHDFHWDHANPYQSGQDDGAWHHLDLHGLSAFMQECRDVYSSLGNSQRSSLEALLGAPLAEDVLQPKGRLEGYEAMRQRSVKAARTLISALPRYNKTDAERLKAKIRSSVVDYINATGIEEPPWLYQKKDSPRFGKVNLIDFLIDFDHQSGLSKMDWLETIEPSQVLPALQHGRVAHFDATKILPKEVFHVTTADLVRIQGSGIPMQVRNSPSYLCSFATSTMYRMIPYSELLFCPRPPKLDTFDGRLATGKISLRRMKKFIDLDEKILHALNLSEDVERSEGQLWFGGTTGGLHWDETDNIIVCLSGVLVVTALSSNYTDALHGGKSPTPPVGNFTHLPVNMITLLPGDGIVIPSRTYHNVELKIQGS